MKRKVNPHEIMNDVRQGNEDGSQEFQQDQQEYQQYRRQQEVSLALSYLKGLSGERRQVERGVGDLRKRFFQNLIEKKSSKYSQNLDSLDKENSDLLHQQFFPRS